MRKGLLTAIGILFMLGVSGQDSLFLAGGSGILVDAQVNARGLNMEAFIQYARGGEVPTDRLNRVKTGFQQQNALGWCGLTKAEARIGKSGLFLGAMSAFMGSATFSKNVGRLALTGNQPMEEQHLKDLTWNVSLLNLSGFGVGWNHGPFWIQACGGAAWSQVSSTGNVSDFYTASFARNLTLTGAGTVMWSTATQPAVWLNGGVTWQMGNAGQFAIAADQLGVMFPKQTSSYQADTQITFQGYPIPPLSQLLNGGGRRWADSLGTTYALTKQTGGKNQLIPPRVQLQWHKQWASGRALTVDITYLYMPGFLPQITLKHGWKTQHLFWQAGVMAGGWGTINSLVGIGGNRWALDISGMESFAFPKSLSGARVKLQWRFGR